MTINEAIIEYNASGVTCLPANPKTKVVTLPSWKKYQIKPPEEIEIKEWSNRPNNRGVCLVCGTGVNLEIIDFDAGGEKFLPWVKLVPQELFDKLVCERTQRGGFHVIYKCENEVGPSQKLAQRKVGDEIITLIETRGKKGYCLVAPSDGYILKQGTITNLPILTADEREDLLSFARSLNEYYKNAQGDTQKVNHSSSYDSKTNHYDDDNVRPGDDFNSRHSCAEILSRNGWKEEGAGLWCRPGKQSGTSGQLFQDGGFHCYSTSTVLETGVNYQPFSLLTALEHNGNFSQAATALSAEGYGTQRLSRYSNKSASRLSTDRIDECYEDDDDDFVEEDINKIHEWSEKDKKIIYDVPGLMGEIFDFCMNNAYFPNKKLALAGAITMMSYLTGKKIKYKGTCTNLYLIALAPSGAGKNYPREINDYIMQQIGMSNALGDGFASGEGIMDMLQHNDGCMLFQNDEIDGVVRQMKYDKNATMETIGTVLLKIYSASNTSFTLNAKAGKGKGRKIERPHLTILGTATPNLFYEALSQRMLNSGFFARLMILDIAARGQSQSPGSVSDMPISIINQAQWWRSFHPSICETNNDDDFGDWNSNARHSYTNKTVACYDVPLSSTAQGRINSLREIEGYYYNNAIEAGDSVAVSSWSRFTEAAMKLSLLYAASRDCRNMVLDDDALRWGGVLALNVIKRQLSLVREWNYKSEFDEVCQKIIQKIKSNNGKITRSALSNHMRLSPFILDQAIEGLKDQKRIKEVFEKMRKDSQRKTKFYALRVGVKKEK